MTFDNCAWGMPRNTNYTFVLQSAFAKDKSIKVKKTKQALYKNHLAFGPVQNVHGDIWLIININQLNPIFMQDLNPDLST